VSKPIWRPLTALMQAPKLLMWGRVRPAAFRLSFMQLAILMLVAVAASALAEWLGAGSDARFHMYGINSAFAAWGTLALFIGLALLGVRHRLAPVMAALASISCCLWLVWAVGHWLPFDRLVGTKSESLWIDFTAGLAAFVAYLTFFVRSGYRTVRQLVPEATRKRAALSALAMILAMFAYPSQPLFWGSASTLQTSNVWEMARAFWPSSVSPGSEEMPKPLDVEAIFDRQQRMVEAAVSEVTRAASPHGGYYFVGFAAYAAQNVFKSEIEKVRAVVDERLGTGGRSLNLINHRTTVDTHALASVTNLGRALRLIGSRIDRERDVLVVYLTSHGAEGLFSVNFGDFQLNDLTPDRLRRMLDVSGIKNRVMIISACHSGSFVPALKDDNTVIMTAASAERRSFGCSNEREWTYFGDALFNHALRETSDLIAAFDKAKGLVGQWETKQGLLASEPQISVGPAIAERLAAISADITAKLVSAAPVQAATAPAQE